VLLVCVLQLSILLELLKILEKLDKKMLFFYLFLHSRLPEKFAFLLYVGFRE